MLHIARSDSRAARLHQAACALGGDALLLPSWDCLPYDRAAPSPAVMGARMAALPLLATARLIITSVAAAGQRLPKAQPGLTLRVGDVVDDATLEALGYAAEEVVDAPGDFAHRGAVLDAWPALLDECPHRLELDDAGRILAIRRFDALTQRSLNEAEQLHLPPAHEPLAPDAMDSLFDLLPEARLVLEPEVTELREAAVAEVADAFRLRLVTATAAEDDAPPLVEPALLYLDAAAWKAALRGRDVLELDRPEDAPEGLGFLAAEDPQEAFLDAVEAVRERGCRVALAGAGERATTLARLLRARFGPLPETPGWLALNEAVPGTLAWLRQPLLESFATKDVLVVAASQILPPRPLDANTRLPLPEAVLAPGDAVIHMDHGVAALRGLERVQGTDCLKLEFAAGHHRLVPVEELDRIWRYGALADAVSLDRVGGEAWARRRTEAEAALQETAAGLVELARA